MFEKRDADESSGGHKMKWLQFLVLSEKRFSSNVNSSLLSFKGRGE